MNLHLSVMCDKHMPRNILLLINNLGMLAPKNKPDELISINIA